MPHSPLRRISLVDQAVEHLRDGIRAGRWKGHLPGMLKLAGELGVSRNTTVEAVTRLIAEGVILAAEERLPHAIAGIPDAPHGKPALRHLRVAILLMTAMEKQTPAHQRKILRIITELKSIGHECVPVVFPAGKDLDKTGYLPRLLRDSAADAWLVFAGTHAILEWFAAGKTPVLAIGGRCRTLPIAAVADYDASIVVRTITRRLIELGHRRIVLFTAIDSRRPTSGMFLSFREELEAAGIKPGEFNVPDWEETPEGLVTLLKSLFRFTPPTAIICNSLHSTCGTATFLTRLGLDIPKDVSVVSFTHEDPLTAWTFPGADFAHVKEDESPFFRRIREWVTQVAENRTDTRQVWCEARFVEGNTIGPAKAPAGR